MTITLRRGSEWVTLAPLTLRTATVVDGTVFHKGDRVANRENHSWEDLAQALSNPDPAADPFPLDLIRGRMEYAPSFTTGELAGVFEVEDSDPCESSQVDLGTQDADAMARAFSAEMARLGPRAAQPRRRKSDVA